MVNIRNIIRLNWTATIRLNYKAGGIACVMAMPIKVYGRLKHHVSGKIVLPKDAIRSTLVIGSEHEDYTASSGKAELNIQGEWRINGLVRIGHDCFIGIEKGGMLEMNNGSYFGRDTQIHCYNSIRFGSGIFAGEMYATDSTIHQMYKDGKEQQSNGCISVGSGTYLGFRTMLLKDCHIPPRSVVASGAVCNRDYTKDGDAKLLLAGVPAVVKSTNTFATI